MTDQAMMHLPDLRRILPADLPRSTWDKVVRLVEELYVVGYNDGGTRVSVQYGSYHTSVANVGDRIPIRRGAHGKQVHPVVWGTLRMAGDSGGPLVVELDSAEAAGLSDDARTLTVGDVQFREGDYCKLKTQGDGLPIYGTLRYEEADASWRVNGERVSAIGPHGQMLSHATRPTSERVNDQL